MGRKKFTNKIEQLTKEERDKIYDKHTKIFDPNRFGCSEDYKVLEEIEHFKTNEELKDLYW